MSICLATEQDLQTIISLIDGAAEWLRGKDTDQWERPWPDEAGRERRIREQLAGGNGHTFIVRKDGQPVATVSIVDKGNDLLWTEEERRTPAVYLHRLVVDRELAGHGLGSDLITWAAEWGRREYGAKIIRIDVWRDNLALHKYYQREGFTGPDGRDPEPELRVEKQRWPSGALMQRKITELAPSTWPNTERFAFKGRVPHSVRTSFVREVLGLGVAAVPVTAALQTMLTRR